MAWYTVKYALKIHALACISQSVCESVSSLFRVLVTSSRLVKVKKQNLVLSGIATKTGSEWSQRLTVMLPLAHLCIILCMGI